jgi:SSS family transporter
MVRMDALAHLPMFALPLAVFGPLDWVIVAIYFAAMIYIGVIAARKDQDTREYFLAHRSMPTWAVAISIVATSLSAATFVGAPDAAFNGNISYLILNVGGLLAVILVATLFVPKLYRAGTVTVYGYVNQRYGETAMIAVSLMFLVGRMLASGARLFIAAFPLCLLMFARANDPRSATYEPTHAQMVLAICLIGCLGTFYTAFGGIRTVIWIDVIQFFIVVGAALLSIFLLFHAIPRSPLQIVHTLLEPVPGPSGHSKLFLCDLKLDFANPYTLWAAIFGATFLNAAAYGVDQDLAQRFLVAKSVTRGALSLIWAQLISIVVICGFLLIGLLLYVFYKRPDVMGSHAPIHAPGTQAAYPWYLLNELPTILSGISIVGFFAIAQGSMDSAINALASSAVADIYHPLRRRFGRPIDTAHDSSTPKIAVALMGLCMSGLGILCVFLYDKHNRTLIDFALGVLSFSFAGMLGVFLTALLTRRGNTTSVILALLAGVAAVVLMQPKLLELWTGKFFGHPLHLASTWWMPLGTLVSFAVGVSGSRREIGPCDVSIPADKRGFEVAPPAAE